jgi:hypothetical protein
MALPRTGRYLNLLRDTTITAAGIYTLKGVNTQLGIHPPYTLNPRFVLNVSAGVYGGGPIGRMRIEHSLYPGVWHTLFEEFLFTADGSFSAYCEDMATRYPFDTIRVNVTEFTQITSIVANLAGMFDHV